jgi:signal transduction histidine kinase
MRRLYLQIYLSFAAILALFALLASLAWALRMDSQPHRQMSRDLAAVMSEVLPPADAPREEVRARLEALGGRFDADLTLRAADRSVIAEVGDPLPPPEPERERGGWIRGARKPTLSIRLDDGRWLVASHPADGRGRHAFGWLAVPLLLAGAVALGAYPVVRRLTGRLERLQLQVDELGAGDLSARVEVEGRDEVAELARSFNRAADQIEGLFDAKRSLLASASHELRTPLARIRVAIELLQEQPRPDLRAQISRDIEELDQLIGELLLASRLDTPLPSPRFEPVDLLALVAEESAATGAQASGDACEVLGDPRMLRRLVRNLLENAARYGEGSPVEASVERLGASGALLRVCDRGPGVAAEERERIFEPFYRPTRATEASDRGSGLGLHLVRQIAEHHGGSAGCEERDGGGSCFRVRLWESAPA